MEDDYLPYLGLLPLIPYAVVFYISLRMPHARSSFWLWTLGWCALGFYILSTGTVRISVVINTITGADTFRLWRFLIRFAGDVALMLFVVTLRMIFPSEQTLWGDVKSDAARVCHMSHKLAVWGWQQLRRLRR